MIARALAALAALFLFSISAEASVKTFHITWSGDEFGNAITAHGRLTIDTAAIGSSWLDTISIPDPSVLDLRITVSGAGSDDGLYVWPDIIGLSFWTPTPLDYTKELIGQPLSNGCTFGRHITDPCGSESGDFNVFGYFLNGVDYFAMQIRSYTGPRIAVTSIMPDVPEPATGTIVLVGVMALLRRRRAVHRETAG